jgi:hypothetical protein
MSGHGSKKYKLVTIAAVLILLGSIFALNRLHRNSTPWAEIHPGMTRAAVLAIAGTPQESGWPENIVETWHKGSRILQHRLSVSYEDGTVREVCEGSWIPYFGWLRPRVEKSPNVQ